jgi:hypothetical protein
MIVSFWLAISHFFGQGPALLLRNILKMEALAEATGVGSAVFPLFKFKNF